MRAAWLKLRGVLIGPDFHSRMERYVAIDVFEDKFDEEGQHVDKAEPEISKLASEAISRPQALADELPWLVREAANGFRFGHMFGTKDETLTFLGNSQLSAQASIVVEHEKRFDPGEQVAGVVRSRLLRQGDAALSFYRRMQN